MHAVHKVWQFNRFKLEFDLYDYRTTRDDNTFGLEICIGARPSKYVMLVADYLDFHLFKCFGVLRLVTFDHVPVKLTEEEKQERQIRALEIITKIVEEQKEKNKK